jgi:hypothetical protein
MSTPVATPSPKSAKYRRARLRHLLFTLGPHRLTRGRSTQRHLEKDVLLRELPINSPRWPAAFDGLRIAHVSDFHLGPLLPLDRALAVVERIAEQKPDLLAITGDLVDLHNHDAGPVLAALAAVDAPMGAMMVMGNHDHLHNPRELAEMARAAGLTVLDNEQAAVRRGSDRLLVAGIDWAKSAARCARHLAIACGADDGESAPTGEPPAHLLLAHNPRAFPPAAHRGIPLTLAGHTHGGQVALKSRPERNLALAHRRSAGLYDSHGHRLFVTTGVGAWFPLRVNCPAEIAVLTACRGEVPHEERGNGAARQPRRRHR